VNSRWVFPMVGVAALLAGSALWLASRAPDPPRGGRGSEELYAATFWTRRRQSRAIPGKIVVLNFWATWCALPREMPAAPRPRRWEGQASVRGPVGEKPTSGDSAASFSSPIPCGPAAAGGGSFRRLEIAWACCPIR
jgi:hypothetical protein